MLILLLGPPGCGKTVIGRRLAERLNYTWVDVDDHSMEPEWWCCVSEKLRKLGDQFFIEEEGRLLKEAASTICSGTVVSLTGSNLLDSSVINVLELRKDAIFIYLDVNHNDIIDRLGITKLRKIVGAFTGGLKIEKPITGVDSEDEIEEATTSEQILKIMQARSALYENHFDIRIWPKIGVTADELEHDVAKSLDDYIKARHDAFTSTREMNEKRTWGFSEAILECLAPERGLFVPKRPLPGFEIGVLQRLSRLRYQDKAKIILEKLIHPSRADPQQIDAMVRCAFNPLNFEDPRIVPVVAVGTSEIYVAELFHGPSGSFKDLSLQLLPQLLSGLMAQNEKHLYLVLSRFIQSCS